jgi:transposase
MLAQWTQAAEASGIQPLMKFAKTLHHYAYGLLNHCDYPINNGRLEGFNTILAQGNKIKVIKRRCYRAASRRMVSTI